MDTYAEKEFLPRDEAEDSVSVEYDGKAGISSTAQNGVNADDELSDIDIDSINRLISELTHEE